MTKSKFKRKKIYPDPKTANSLIGTEIGTDRSRASVIQGTLREGGFLGSYSDTENTTRSPRADNSNNAQQDPSTSSSPRDRNRP